MNTRPIWRFCCTWLHIRQADTGLMHGLHDGLVSAWLGVVQSHILDTERQLPVQTRRETAVSAPSSRHTTGFLFSSSHDWSPPFILPHDRSIPCFPSLPLVPSQTSRLVMFSPSHPCRRHYVVQNIPPLGTCYLDGLAVWLPSSGHGLNREN